MTSFALLAPTALAAPVVIMISCHYDVIRYWAGHAQRDGRTYVYGHLTAFNI